MKSNRLNARRGMASCALVLAGWLLAGAADVSAQSKPPLDHDAYDIWNRIEAPALSNDGRRALWTEGPIEKDGTLLVRDLESGVVHRIPRGHEASFAADGRLVVFRIAPPVDSVRQARRDGRKGDALPKDSLGILDLSTGAVVRAARVKSYRLPANAGAMVAYLHEKPLEAKGAATDTSATGAAKTPTDKDEATKEEGTDLVLRDLQTGEETRFAHVTSYRLSHDGRWLVFTTSTQAGEGDGIYSVETATGRVTPVMTGKGRYLQAVLDTTGTQLAFLSDRDDAAAEQPSFTLYQARPGDTTATPLARAGDAALPTGWWVSEHGTLRFSNDGRRLFFGTAPRPAPDPDDDVPEDEQVKLDVWNWKDPYLQPMQLARLEDERKRTYQAVVHLNDRRIVQLATETVPDVAVGAGGDADVAVGHSDLPYRQLISWDWPAYHDVYLVDVETGARRRVLEQLPGRAALSPGARYLTWWDRDAAAWFARPADPAGSARPAVNLTSAIPHPVYDEPHDRPFPAGPYGLAGWTEGDGALLVYDAYDVWAVDPAGRTAPRAVTEGAGRRRGLRFRYVALDPDAKAIDPARPMLLSAFDTASRAAGFFRDQVRGDRPPEELVFRDRYLSTPSKARDGDVLLFTMESFRDFPDLWVADLDFAAMRRISEANPQQERYRWGTAERVTWTSLDGDALEGLLYRPDGFDPARRYPMLVYFYERNSDNLHRHWAPAPHRSIINISFYVSRGYLVFVPDIPYKEGYPGESAVNAVLPGVTHLIEQGFVDRERIGVQGHSWGGYQIAYLVTQTNLFAAAEAGAPVANMVSAYGGIRWGTGMSRMFQYERTQSRIGGSLWERPMHYIQNSPIFQAHKIRTPLLMMHNDQDDAVPWYQGIELFVALRRLGKPVWLLNYNDERHGLRRYANQKDWAVRMQQFFDHFLMDAPPPVWMERGIPALDKGRTLGLEPVEAPLPVLETGDGRLR